MFKKKAYIYKMKLLIIILLLFSSCRVCYTKSRYEKELLKNERYHYIEKTPYKNNGQEYGLKANYKR